MSKLEKIWILFWYNDITRLFLVLIPTYFIILVPLLKLFNFSDELLGRILLLTYIFILMLAGHFNDYSNLRKIGLDEYRKPLKEENKNE